MSRAATGPWDVASSIPQEIDTIPASSPVHHITYVTVKEEDNDDEWVTFAYVAAYIVAQLLGASLGALPLLAWGSMGRSVAFGATIPGAGYSTANVVMGEAVTTCGLVATLCICLAFRRLRPYTPFVIPIAPWDFAVECIRHTPRFSVILCLSCA